MTTSRSTRSLSTACALMTLLLLPTSLIGQAVAEGFLDPTRSTRTGGHVLLFETSGSVPIRGCAGEDQVIGEFAISVRLHSGRRVTTPLNPIMGGRSLRFPAARATLPHIVLDDYNGDGRPDFALSEVSCGTLVGYYLFTIADSGRVRPLRLENGGLIGMMGESISALIPTSPVGLVAPIFNNLTVKGEAVIYRWNARRALFEFVRRAVGERPDLDTPNPWD